MNLKGKQTNAMKKIFFTIIGFVLIIAAVSIFINIPDGSDNNSSSFVEKTEDGNGDSNLLNYIPSPDGYIPEPVDPSVMPEYPDFVSPLS